MTNRTMNQTAKKLAITACLIWSGTGFAIAQNGAAADAPDPGYAPAVRYPSNGFSFIHHSSTIAEGAMRGAADLTRAIGSANLDNSLANMNNQEAIRRALENSLKYAETYYARRDLWFDYQEEHRRKPLTMEGYRKLAEAAGADRLTAEQFDSATGKVRWPDMLQAKTLEPYRVRIDNALANRSNTDVGYGSKTHEEVRRMTESMPSKEIPRMINGSTVISSSVDEAKPQADTAPPDLVCLSKFAK